MGGIGGRILEKDWEQRTEGMDENQSRIFLLNTSQYYIEVICKVIIVDKGYSNFLNKIDDDRIKRSIALARILRDAMSSTRGAGNEIDWI